MQEKKYYLAACCILKDEDPFIAEWLTYHSRIGVEHFFVYDNESANPLAENPLIQKFTTQGKLTLTSFPGRTMQIPAYDHCLANFGPLCQWIAFIDLDEFICPVRADDMRPLLSDYEDYAGLALNWKSFGSAGHLTRPEGLVIKNYQERFIAQYSANMHVKSIIQPDKNKRAKNAHVFFPKPGHTVVNEHYRPLPYAMPVCPISWDIACVHHYVLKSREDAQRRVIRGRADIKSDKPTISLDDFDRLSAEKQEPDKNIVRFAWDVEEAMTKQELPCWVPQPQNPENPQSYITLSKEYLLGKQPHLAEITLCHAAMLFPQDPLIWLARAMTARKMRRYQRARNFIYKAIRLNELPQVYLELLYLCIDSGEKDEGRAVLFYLQNTPSFKVQNEKFYEELQGLEEKLK